MKDDIWGILGKISLIAGIMNFGFSVFKHIKPQEISIRFPVSPLFYKIFIFVAMEILLALLFAFVMNKSYRNNAFYLFIAFITFAGSAWTSVFNMQWVFLGSSDKTIKYFLIALLISFFSFCVKFYTSVQYCENSREINWHTYFYDDMDSLFIVYGAVHSGCLLLVFF